MELQHISHEHPLVFIQDPRSAGVQMSCSACGEGVEGPCYCCSGCKFYLHKTCAELELSPEINHPFHPSHPLIFLPKSPYSGTYSSGKYDCNLCSGTFSGLVYHCASCQFDLDIHCASMAGNFDKLQYPFHEHPFIFIETHDRIIKADCSACTKEISSGPFYKCLDCLDDVYLHKKCVDLPLEIRHPFHPLHPLKPELESTNKKCNLCRNHIFRRYHYHCASCDFSLDINCASIAGSFDKLQHPLHEHPFIFIEKHNRIIRANCWGCTKEISLGPFYKCLDCLEVYLHNKCVDLPLEINNFHDRRHPLTLSHSRPIHPESCSCYLCKFQSKRFVYCCHVCEFILTPEDALSLPEVITSNNHDHPWTLLSRQMSFICDFCGIDGDRTPYLCTACNFIVHKDCSLLPRTIAITRHHHRLSHSYSLKGIQFDECKCRICYKKVNTGYGSYYCPVSDCSFIAHVNCATSPSIWDPNHEDELSEGESMNLITGIVQTKYLSGGEIATEIKHAFHNHNLVLTFSGDTEDDSNCDGCMRLISTPFYVCKECKFYLHKSCAELPREKRHPSHMHLLTLSKNEDFSVCTACQRLHHGFIYRCRTLSCRFDIDIQCSLLSVSFKHPSHEHPIFLDHNYKGNCIGCSERIRNSFAYRCTEGCDEFILEFNCLTLPEIAWYKYDKHPFTLTYDAGSDPDQFYCDICEEKRDPNKWFYSCVDCDNSAHLQCILGELPFIKVGRTIKWVNVLSRHEHQLSTFVKNIWNCPPCNGCKRLCYGQALRCTECNFNSHWNCRLFS